VSQQVMLRPLGIITQPNKMGSIPAGAFREAYAGYIRDPGVLETAVNWTLVQDISASVGGNTTPKMYVVTFPNASSTYCLTLWQHASTQWAFTWTDLSGAGTAQTDFLYNDAGYTGAGRQILSSNGLVSWVTTRNRTLLACELGTIVWDYTTPGSTLQAHPRQSGMLPPAASPYTGGTIASAGGGALEALTYCHITAVLRRVYDDGYEIVSAPAACRPIVGPYADYVTIRPVFGLPTPFAKAGDYIDVYRTRSQPYTNTLPYVATSTGSDFYKSATLKLTAAHIAARLVTVDDATPDGSLGESLYTNDGVQGSAAAAAPPPTAKVVRQFKGHVFYFNLVEPAQFKLRVPAHWGNIDEAASSSYNAYARAYGVGIHSFVGSTTSGSAVITGVAAADIVGLAVGQDLAQPTAFPFGSGATVTAVGVSTVTVSINAAATVAAATGFYTSDVIEVDGNRYRADGIDTFIYDLVSPSTNKYTASLLSRVPTSYAAYPGAPTIPGDYLVIHRRDMWGSSSDTTKYEITVRATNGHLYDPQLPRMELAETARTFTAPRRKNGWAWSERDQPENVPSANYNSIGSGEILGAYETRDACFVFSSDGLWRISGNGGQVGSGYDWRADLVHKSIRLAGPQGCVAMHDVGYAYTNLGFVSIDSSGNVTQISEGVIGDLLPGLTWPSTATYTPSTCVFLIADPDHNEIIIRAPSNATNVFWRYNAHSGTFMWDTAGTSPLHGSYSEYLKAPIIALSSDSGKVYAQNGTTYRTLDVSYQPVFADSPFSQKHWQLVNVVADDVTSAVSVYSNGTLVGTRTLTPGGFGSYARQGYAIQRAAGAMGNNISVSLQVAAGAAKTRLQGVAIDYVAFTDQRAKR